MFPPSPLLSQGLDIDANLLCSSDSKPSYCQDNATICECVHVINIPLHARVEIILIDQGKCGDISVILFVHIFILG